MFEFEEDLGFNAKIKVVGVGGGGCNALQTMIREKIEGVDFVVMNTDLQALKMHEATVKIQFGHQLTKGLGSGANPEIGRDAAMEDIGLIREALKGSDMIFVTAGMGGGTGTGAAPVIASVAKEMGILTVGVVTKPFSFEGQRRMRQAEAGIKALKDHVDTLICIPNDNLLSLVAKDTPILDSFKMIDYVLLQAVRGISDLITTPGLINLDFADIKTIISDAGVALMGTGIAVGENRAIEAAKLAITSPLLEDVSIAGATGVLLNITGSTGMTLFEVNEASKLIQQECHEDVNIIFGTVVDTAMEDEIRVTVIATGFGEKKPAQVKKEKALPLNKEVSTKKWFDFSKALEPASYNLPSLNREETKEVAQQKPVVAKPASPQKPAAQNLSIKEVFDDMTQKPAAQKQQPIQQLNLLDAHEDDEVEEAISTFNPNEPSFRPETLSLSMDGSVSSSAIDKGPSWGESASMNTQTNVQSYAESMQKNSLERKSASSSEKKRIIPEVSYKDQLDSDEYDIPAFIRKRAD